MVGVRNPTTGVGLGHGAEIDESLDLYRRWHGETQHTTQKVNCQKSHEQGLHCFLKDYRVLKWGPHSDSFNVVVSLFPSSVV